MAKQEKARARGVLLIATMLLVTVVGGLVVAGAAGAAPNQSNPRDPYFSPSDTVLPSRISTPPPRTHSVVPPPNDEVLGKRPPSNLPFTGADLTLFVITGVAAIATGTILVRRTRARRQSS
jgi:hypothetical protein